MLFISSFKNFGSHTLRALRNIIVIADLMDSAVVQPVMYVRADSSAFPVKCEFQAIIVFIIKASRKRVNLFTSLFFT